MANTDSPKTFISYAWTSEDHKSLVRSLAERLRDDGVDATLDQWDLKPGHDAIAFMEQIVTDPNVKKVIIVCDLAYVEKSNARKGGVGTEAQIISPGIYAKADQDKFVVVSVERDETGEPCRPAFYNSRIAIPMDDENEFEARYEELLRWVFDKPLRPKPPLGKRPALLLDEAGPPRRTSVLAETRVRALRQGRGSSMPQTQEFLAAALEDLRQCRPIEEHKDRNMREDIADAISAMLPLSNHLCEVFKGDIAVSSSLDHLDPYRRFLEKALDLTESGEGWFAPTTWSLDHHRFFVEELFCRLISLTLAAERFDATRYLTSYRYVTNVTSGAGGHQSRNYSVFSQHVESLETGDRNHDARHAALLEARCSGGPLAFEDYMQGDFFLYLDAIIKHKSLMTTERWWPHSLVRSKSRYRPFDVFIRAESARYADKLALAFGIENGGILQEKLAAIALNEETIPKWSYHRLRVSELCNVEHMNKFG
jgi:hypothetical protein